MTQQRQPPSEALLEEFAQRLEAFRGTLPDEQRPLLDTMLIAALRPARC